MAKFLNETGLSKLWEKIKNTFAKKTDTMVELDEVTADSSLPNDGSFIASSVDGGNHIVAQFKGKTGGSICRLYLNDNNTIDVQYSYTADGFANANKNKLATEEYVNNKVGSGGGSVGTITKYELLGGDDIDLSVYGYSAIDVFIGSMNENSIGNIIFDNTDIHSKFAVTDRECYTANLHIRKVGSEFYAYYLDNNGNGKCFSFTDTDFNLSCDCSSSNTFYIVMEKR